MLKTFIGILGLISVGFTNLASAGVSCKDVKFVGVFELKSPNNQQIFYFKETPATPGVYRVAELEELCPKSTPAGQKCGINSSWKIYKVGNGEQYREKSVGFWHRHNATYPIASLIESHSGTCSIAWYDPVTDDYETNLILETSSNGDLTIGGDVGMRAIGTFKRLGAIENQDH